jgi:hypothetical protein
MIKKKFLKKDLLGLVCKAFASIIHDIVKGCERDVFGLIDIREKKRKVYIFIFLLKTF